MQSTSGKNIPVSRLAVILGALATFGAFGTDMYLSAFPSMAAYFHTSVAQVQITLSVYFFGLAVGQLIYGPMVDRFGRLKPLLAGLFLFFVTSALLLVAPNIKSFILLRLLQAIGGCSGMIVGRAIVSDLFDLQGSAKFLSMLAIVQGLGPIIAPMIGSYMLTVSTWKTVFIFLTCFGCICLIGTAIGLPETLPSEKRQAIGPAKIIRDYASLCARRSFIVPALACCLAGSSLFAYISASSFVFMHIYGMSPGKYGMVFAIMFLSSILSAPVNSYLLRKAPPQKIFNGVLVFNIIVILIQFLVTTTAHVWLFMIPLWFCMAASPLIFANGMAVAMESCRDKAGSASALIGLFQFGMASIASVAVSVFDNGTAYPMVFTMFGGVILGTIINLFAPRSGKEQHAMVASKGN